MSYFFVAVGISDRFQETIFSHLAKILETNLGRKLIHQAESFLLIPPLAFVIFTSFPCPPTRATVALDNREE